eukprot:7030333-Prymnesium_polylepis.1
MSICGRGPPHDQWLQHVLSVGLRAGNGTLHDISVRTRSDTVTKPRTVSDFSPVAEVAMGRTHLSLSSGAEATLQASMASAQPMVVRSMLSEHRARCDGIG